MSFDRLVADLDAMRRRRQHNATRAIRQRPRDPAMMLKSLQDTVAVFSGNRNQRTSTGTKPRQQTRTALLGEFDALLNRAVEALKKGEITAVQVSELESRVNNAIAQMKAEGKL